MRKGKGSSKRKPQSRLDYEERNPTMSVRLPKEIMGKLRANLTKQGQSLADALIAIANDLEVKGKSYDEAWQEGHDEGLVEGHSLAEDMFKVTYHCSVCGKLIELETTEEKEAASLHMTEHGWAHGECDERRRRR